MGPDFVLVQGGLEPLGRYTLTNDFYVMTTEVTQGMWTSVMNGSGYGYTPSYYDGTGPLYPVYNVSWYDAIAFANRLSVLTGREECYANTDNLNVDPQQEYNPDDVSSSFSTPYDCRGFRLLTDAEWEYAARSGTTSDFWTGQSSALGGTYSSNNCTGLEMILDGVGNPLLTDYAWYCGYDINSSLGDGSKGVGQKKPNGFGLYDMHGNVWEWVNDWYGCAYPESTTNPYCNSVGSYRANRGGGWYYYPLHLSVANRDSSLPTYRDYGDLGFRLGITP
jgi:formylglycine-generating enzyme required for sulfatase activity